MRTATAKEKEIAEQAKAILAARSSVNLGRPLPQGVAPKLVVEDVPHDVRAWEDAVNQVRKAKETLSLPAGAFMQYPFPALAQLIGGVRPNRVHQFVMASNVGKTTTVRSFIEGAIKADQSCAVMTTETTTDDFRLAMAASEIGVEVGDVATGEYLTWPNADAIRIRLEAALDKWADYDSGSSAKLKITSSGYLTPKKVRAFAKEAADLGIDWTLYDHEDHVEAADGLTEPGMSNAVVSAIWASTVDYDQRAICMSQLNQDVFRNVGALGMCTTPQEGWVKYGGKKKEQCWVMVGGSRPLRKFADEKERASELAAFKAGERTIADITLPGIAFRLMKHRDYGKRVGATVVLEVQNGRIVTSTREVGGAVHGIRTNRDVA